jgi:hypothetical protein
MQEMPRWLREVGASWIPPAVALMTFVGGLGWLLRAVRACSATLRPPAKKENKHDALR